MPTKKKTTKTQAKEPMQKPANNLCKPKGSCGGCSYFLGFMGALIYYTSTATGFWNGVWGVIKALLWPAFLVYGALKFIGA